MNDVTAFSHAPAGYVCPFCLVVQGIENEHVHTLQDDVVYRDEDVTSFVCAAFWPNNPGHVLVVPNAHFENIYTMSGELLGKIQEVGRIAGLGFKELYHCDGVSSRQHNEPAGNQDVWHYHLHVYPRYEDDRLYFTTRRSTTPEERRPYAEKLKRWFDEQS